MIMLHVVPRIVKYPEGPSRMVDARAVRRREWGVTFQWVQSFSFARARGQEMVGGDGCTTG